MSRPGKQRMSKGKRTKIINALIAQVENWDGDNLVGYVQEHMRTALENADNSVLKHDYELLIGPLEDLDA